LLVCSTLKLDPKVSEDDWKHMYTTLACNTARKREAYHAVYSRYDRYYHEKTKGADGFSADADAAYVHYERTVAGKAAKRSGHLSRAAASPADDDDKDDDDSNEEEEDNDNGAAVQSAHPFQHTSAQHTTHWRSTRLRCHAQHARMLGAQGRSCRVRPDRHAQ
jgi:hypothetical protein